MSQVLIVDDEIAMRAGLEASFRRRGWKVESAAGVTEAMKKFRQDPAQVVVTDMCMPDGNGLHVMQGVRGHIPGTPVIFLTAYGNVSEAVQAMREGACDYLQKPVTFEALQGAVERFLRAIEPHSGIEDFEGVANSPDMQFILAQARRVAHTDADVLIEAESGTGKELLARFIHRNSSRKNGPFVAVNCSAFPDNLLESELFGHVKGAFTGANNAKAGKFSLANEGILLLDEIGEMSPSLQPKLLRVLQEREIDPLGDVRPQPVDVRVIATTNRNLPQKIASVKFREDLFYRINVEPLTMPPLRQRRSDIIPLAKHFIRKYAESDDRGSCSLSSELVAQLESHDWPGNVRELENLIRRLLALRSGTLLQPLPARFNAIGPGKSSTALCAGTTLYDAERQLLEKTLVATGGNRTRTAQMMGVSLRTVRNKIREYGLAARSVV
jgi:DNA-binding NtrC family response regulator